MQHLLDRALTGSQEALNMLQCCLGHEAVSLRACPVWRSAAGPTSATTSSTVGRGSAPTRTRTGCCSTSWTGLQTGLSGPSTCCS